MHVREAKVAARSAKGEFFVIEAEQFENRRVQVVNVNFVLSRRETKLIGRAMNVAAFDAAACHPHREAVVIMIAAIDLAGI